MLPDVPEWKQLENSVAQIEAALAGAPVKVSQTRVRDPDTGRLRQVDVAVTGRLGGTDIFVIIECRHHSVPQDVQWVEEAIGRRQSLKADKIVLVSSSGFTGEAAEKAAKHHVSVRSFEDISPEAVRDWITLQRIFVVRRNIVLRKCHIFVKWEKGDPDNLDLADHVKRGTVDIRRAIAWDKSHRIIVTCSELMHQLGDQQPTGPVEEALAASGASPLVAETSFKMPPEIVTDTTAGERTVDHIDVSVSFEYSRGEFAPSEGLHKAYRADSGVLAVATKIETPVNLGGFVMTLITSPDGAVSQLSFHRDTKGTQ